MVWIRIVISATVFLLQLLHRMLVSGFRSSQVADNPYTARDT
jgi:hypothetical protein